MSILLEKVLKDAQLLVGKTRNNENLTENLLSQFKNLHTKLEESKKFQPPSTPIKLEESSLTHNLDLSLFPKNDLITSLEKENEELRRTLEEHQATMELIMSKYRQRINSKLTSQSTPHVPQADENFSKKLEKIEEINNLAGVMWQALEAEDDSYAEETQLVQLHNEYESLKQLVFISQSFGNNCIFNEDKLSQLFVEPASCFENDQSQSYIKLSD